MPPPAVSLLIVEDHEALRTTLSHIFVTLGHRVRCAADGFSGLGELRLEVPQIILSDLNMPGMSGYEFLSVVRRRFPTVKVIAMSSEFAVDSMPLGVAADAFYRKGSNLGSLLQIVERMTIQEPPQSLKPGAMPAPIWVERTEQDASGRSWIVLTCPECLRAFPGLLCETADPMQETNCSHCNSVFQYAVVRPSEPIAARRKATTDDAHTEAPRFMPFGWVPSTGRLSP